MAKVYLASLMGKNLKLACRKCDVVSVGAEKVKPCQKLNQRKLERLFKGEEIVPWCLQKPELFLTPEDVVNVSYILVLDKASPDAANQVREKGSPDEAKMMREQASRMGVDRKSNIECKIEPLRRFDEPHLLDQPLLDLVQPGSGENKMFGISLGVFKKHMGCIKKTGDRFLMMDLGYDVEKNTFTAETA